MTAEQMRKITLEEAVATGSNAIFCADRSVIRTIQNRLAVANIPVYSWNTMKYFLALRPGSNAVVMGAPSRLAMGWRTKLAHVIWIGDMPEDLIGKALYAQCMSRGDEIHSSTVKLHYTIAEVKGFTK